MTIFLIALVGILLAWVARLRLTREHAAAAAFAEGHADGKAEAERVAGLQANERAKWKD